MFIHTVLFWLKPDAPADATARCIHDCRELLSAIPTVRYLWAGPPAHTPRPVVDNSYNVGLTVILDDAAGHDIYQSHPLHLQFIAQTKDHLARIQVYDALG